MGFTTLSSLHKAMNVGGVLCFTLLLDDHSSTSFGEGFSPINPLRVPLCVMLLSSDITG